MAELEIETFDVVVVGAGQAGLAMGYRLLKTNLSFVLLDGDDQIGNSWRRRYDSLTLFSARECSALPGLPFPGEPRGYPTKDEVADYLEAYAAHFDLPVRLGSRVVEIRRTKDEFFEIETTTSRYRSLRVVIATGTYELPKVPDLPGSLDEEVQQVHSSRYRSPAALPEGPTVIVGDGPSGRQIAQENAPERPTFLAIGQRRACVPKSLFGRNLFWWLQVLGVSRIERETFLGRLISRKDPIVGFDIRLGALRKAGVKIRPRVASLDGRSVCFEDGSSQEVASVVWSTGFHYDFRWIKVEGAADENGQPLHRYGVGEIPGLFYLGMNWQRTRSSGLLLGVGEDAALVREHVLHSPACTAAHVEDVMPAEMSDVRPRLWSRKDSR